VNQPPLSSGKTIHSDEGPQSASPLHNFGSSIGERLRTLMLRQGRSLEKLADYSGLGKKKLGAVAVGEIVPTINLLWKIANALGVPMGSLISVGQRRGMFVLRKANESIISSSDGRFTSRALFPHDCKRLVEFYELTIAPRHAVYSEAHAPCTLESLIVVRGHIEITAGKEPTQRLEEGDAIVFEGDVPHRYRNLGSSEALLYLVMSYINLTAA
jgi:XRE family transcriptional regulator, regulator of sulfur utilization